MHSISNSDLTLATQESFRHCLALLFDVSLNEVPKFKCQPMISLLNQWQEWSQASLGLEMLVGPFAPEHSGHCIALGAQHEGQQCVLWRNGMVSSTTQTPFTPLVYIDFGLMFRSQPTSDTPHGAIDLMQIAANR